MLSWFRRNPGRELGELAAAARKRAALTEQERIRARTRQICREIGKPIPEALQ
jgi:transcription elongation GreA/GreB family factor